MNKKKIILLGLAGFLLIAAAVAIVPVYRLFKVYRFISQPSVPTDEKPGTPQPQPQKLLLPERYYTFLLYGVDAGEWVGDTFREGPARADMILFIQMDMQAKKSVLLSIPRDTLVEIPGRAGDDKINHAHAFGGSALLQKTVEQFTGIPVDYYIQINYRLFKDVVDALGGVEFDVDRKISARGITLTPGPQHLDGDMAFALVSFRYEPMGDIARVRRMQRFLAAVSAQAMQKPPQELFPILYAGWRHVKTNLSIEEAAELLTSLRGQDTAMERTEMVPGWFYNRNGISYWRPDLDATKGLIHELFFREQAADNNQKSAI